MKKNNINFKNIWSTNISRTIISAVIGLFLSWALISLFTKSPTSFINAIIDGSFLNERKIGSFLTVTTILISLGVSLSVCYKANFINLSIPGQLLLSATICYLIAYKIKNNPSLAIFISFILTFVLNSFINVFIILMNKYFKVNMIVLAIMLNWIIFYIYRIYMGTESGNEWVTASGSARTNATANFSGIFGGKLSIFFPILIVLAVGIWIFFKWTPWGFQMIVSGKSIKVAETLGIKSTRNLIWISFISALFSSLAGMVYLFSKQEGVLSTELPAAPAESWIGLVVALMAFSNPIATIPVSFFFALLLQSQTTIQFYAEVNNNVVDLTNGVLMISITSLPFAISRIKVKDFKKNYLQKQKTKKEGR